MRRLADRDRPRLAMRREVDHADEIGPAVGDERPATRRPSGWKTIRLGLPWPRAIVPTTSKVSGSMIEADSDLVLVMNSVAPVAAPAPLRIVARSRSTTSLGTAALAFWFCHRVAILWIAVTAMVGGTPRNVNRTASPTETSS